MKPTLTYHPPTRPTTRERWVFTGRITHWGYHYWTWELTHNPAPGHTIG